jgi:hypothetical protein
VLWNFGTNAATAVQKLVINNNDIDAGDLYVATSDSAVVVGTVPQYFFAEIVLMRKGSLTFIPPELNVTAVLQVNIGSTSGDGTGRMRSDPRVALNLLASLSTVLTPLSTTTYTQV